MSEYRTFDMNKDGDLTQEELATAERALEIELREQKAESHKRMAWTAMCTMVGFTILLFTPWISIERINALSDLSSMFYITNGGIIAAHYGVNAWMTKTK